MPKLKRTDLDLWDKINQIRLIDAAYLWNGAVPVDDDASASNHLLATREMLISAILELGMNFEGSEPKPTDRFTRADYKRIAVHLNERPKFLYLEDRRSKTGKKLFTIKVYKNCHDTVLKIMNEKKCNKTRAAQVAVAQLDMAASTVERNFRRYREMLKEHGIDQLIKKK